MVHHMTTAAGQEIASATESRPKSTSGKEKPTMRNAFSTRLISTICLILALSMTLTGCPQPASTKPPTTRFVEAKAVQPSFACPELLPAETVTAAFNVVASECYVANQVLVIGRKDYIESRPTSLQNLVPLQTLDLSAVLDGARSRNEKLEVPHFPAEMLTDNRLMSVLYAIPESRGTVSKVVSDINSEGKGGEAIADPNYLIGEPGIEGFPHGVVGSPFGDAAAAPGAFLNQWAFTQINVTPSSSGTPDAGGIPIGIFDTFPEPIPLESVSGYAFTVRDDESTKANLSLCVKIPTSHAVITPVSPKSIADHGVFAAYLVQAVAPQSKISLYQVLNEHGDGDLATLNRSLVDFMATTWSSGPGVINLSLGIKRYENPDSTGQGIKWPGACGPWSPDFESIKTQEVVLHLARELGFVVVAAAGNSANGAALTPTVVPPDMPARLGGVIGVAASNSVDGGKLACFSNWGEEVILAPGGEGRGVGQGKCDPAPGDCDQQPDLCKTESLISLMPSSKTGYGYWTGTSFATPLVSGLAARCLGANGRKWIGMAVSEGVSNAISAAAVTTDLLPINGSVQILKRIDVPATLKLCE
jgi:subtilisin family serine protease